MDPSKLKITEKSSETPSTSKHERSRLKQRAGTTWDEITMIGNIMMPTPQKSWSSEGKKTLKSKIASPGDLQLTGGKHPKTGKPVDKKTLFGKKKRTESEY